MILAQPFGSRAQGLDSLDLATLNPAFVCGSQAIDAGDTAVIEIHLGTLNAPVTGALGTKIKLQIGEKSHLPSSGTELYDHSWLADDAEFTSSCEIDPVQRKMNLSCHRSDQQSREGHGEVLRIYLVAAEDSTLPAEMVSFAPGGQVIIENLDMKWMPNAAVSPEKQSDLKLFPNPATSILFLEIEGETPVQIEILDARGMVCRNVKIQGSQPISLPISDLADGLWILRATYTSGQVEAKRFLVR